MKRVLLDESTPRRLARAFRDRDFEVQNFVSSWKGLSDGAVLSAMEAAGIQILLTCDMSMSHQQNLRGRAIGLVVLSKNRQEDLLANIDVITDALRGAQPGRVLKVTIDLIRRRR